MNAQTIIALLETVKDIIDLLEEIQGSTPKESEKHVESKLDPWQSMLFKQSGPERTFPRMCGRRTNLAKDPQSARIPNLRRVLRQNEDNQEDIISY